MFFLSFHTKQCTFPTVWYLCCPLSSLIPSRLLDTSCSWILQCHNSMSCVAKAPQPSQHLRRSCRRGDGGLCCICAVPSARQQQCSDLCPLTDRWHLCTHDVKWSSSSELASELSQSGSPTIFTTSSAVISRATSKVVPAANFTAVFSCRMALF